MSRELEDEYKKNFLGKELSVVIDGRSAGNKYRAKTEYYFDIKFASPEKLNPGELVSVKKWRLI